MGGLVRRVLLGSPSRLGLRVGGVRDFDKQFSATTPDFIHDINIKTTRDDAAEVITLCERERLLICSD